MSTSSPLILILDDHPEFLALYGDILEYEGYRVVRASTVGEALGNLDSGTRPDLMLVDCLLPDPGSEAFLREVHRRFPDVTSEAKLIGFSLLDDHAPQVRALLPLLSGYLSKPDDFEVFLDAIRRWVTSRSNALAAEK